MSLVRSAWDRIKVGTAVGVYSLDLPDCFIVHHSLPSTASGNGSPAPSASVPSAQAPSENRGRVPTFVGRPPLIVALAIADRRAHSNSRAVCCRETLVGLHIADSVF